MHNLQEILIEMARHGKLNGRSYRQIAHDIRAKHGSQVKYHLDRLVRDGFILERKDGTYTVPMNERAPAPEAVTFKRIPLLGAANCGAASMIAEDRVEQFIPVSAKIISRNGKKWFALRAVGNSMNRAMIGGLAIEDGDHVLVDSTDTQPKNGDVVVSVIDGLANIKMLNRDRESGQITLISRSTEDHPPILIHEDDVGSYLVAGKVKHVIKKPKIHWQA